MFKYKYSMVFAVQVKHRVACQRILPAKLQVVRQADVFVGFFVLVGVLGFFVFVAVGALVFVGVLVLGFFVLVGVLGLGVFVGAL